MAHVFLTRPCHQHRRARHGLCDACGQHDNIIFATPPEPAAQIGDVAAHLFGRKSHSTRGRHFGKARRLRPGPDVQPAGGEMRRRTHRFHRGMGQPWHAVFGLDHLVFGANLHGINIAVVAQL